MLTPLPLTLQVPGACEAGLALLPGSNGAAWEGGGSWQAARQDLASCSTSAAPTALQRSRHCCLCLLSTSLLAGPNTNERNTSLAHASEKP